MLDGSIEISASALKSLMDKAENGGLLVVDVRSEEELRIASIKGTCHIPIDTLSIGLKGYDFSRPIVMICHHGIRSFKAAMYARSLGFEDVRSLKGGIEEWSLVVDNSVPRY